MGQKQLIRELGIEPQALQSNSIDRFSFRDEIEIGSSSTTQPTEQGREGLTAVHTQHTYIHTYIQTCRDPIYSIYPSSLTYLHVLVDALLVEDYPRHDPRCGTNGKEMNSFQ